MAVSRKRAKLQPELLSPHAAAPAGDLSAILIGRARSRAKAAATPVIEIADHLPNGDRGAAAASESDTHTNDGLLFKKGAATGSSFRPDYWTFDRPDQKKEVPDGPLLAKRGTAPTPHKPQPPPRAKADPPPKAPQEQIEALQALVAPIEPEEPDPAVTPAPAETQQAEPPPAASLLDALQPPNAPPIQALVAPETLAAPPEPQGDVEAPQEPPLSVADVVVPEVLAEPEIVPVVEPVLPAEPEPVAEIEALEPPPAPYFAFEMPAAAPPVEIAAETVPPPEPTLVEAPADMLTAPPPAIATPAAELIVEPTVDLGPTLEATPQLDAIADALLAIPRPPIDAAPAEPVAEAELPPEVTPPLDTPLTEPVIETATTVALPPEPEAIAEVPAAPEPVIESVAALALLPEPTPPETVAEGAPAPPSVEMPSVQLADMTPPTETTSPPEAVAETIPEAPEPPRELPTVKVAAARAIELKLPAPPPIVEPARAPVAETPAPTPPAPLDVVAERPPEPAPVAKAEPPVAAWRDGLAELKTLLTELRQRTLVPPPAAAPPVEALPEPPQDYVPEQVVPEPPLATPPHAPRALLDAFPEPEELPPQLQATQELPPEVPHEMPMVEPPMVATPVAEPPAADDSNQRLAAEYRPPEEVAVADSLGNLIEDVLSRKSFSIAAVAARQSRTGAFEPAVETSPSEIESVLSAALEPKPADDPMVVEYARSTEIAEPRRRLPLIDRLLAVITAVMLVMGSYFGVELWRSGVYEAMRARLIALPPTVEQPETPIWAERPAKQQLAPAHRPGSAPAR